MPDFIARHTSLAFLLILLICLWIFLLSVRNASSESVRKGIRTSGFILIAWIILQSALAYSGLYHNNMNVIPPRIVLFGVLPAVLGIVLLFISKRGRSYIDSLSDLHLTWLHVIRIPVETILYALFVQGAVPELMTFSGRNFDIISGVTAPLVAYFGVQKSLLNRKIILLWHFICLGLLFNIVIHASLSVPGPLQKLAFEQPNIAILYFPFSLLPAFVVPMVLFSHLVCIRRLLREKNIQV